MKLIMLLLLAGTALAQLQTIGGIVVDGLSGDPLPRVRLVLHPYGNPQDQRYATTKEDGRFSFPVPDGKYLLYAERRGTRQPYGQSAPAQAVRVAIVASPRLDTSELQFKWFEPATIAGIIVDERNQPVEKALVQLIRSTTSEGRKSTTSAAWAYTNSKGEYRFAHCAPGSYYLTATAKPWWSPSGSPGLPADAFAPSHYPNTSDPLAAQPILLAPGTEVQANFTLTLSQGVNIFLSLPSARGPMQVSLVSDGIGGLPTFHRQQLLYGNSGTLAGVLPGSYELRVEGLASSNQTARQRITVDKSDLEITLDVKPKPTIVGTVTFPAPGRLTTVYVQLLAQFGSERPYAKLDQQHRFQFHGITPGRYRVQLVTSEQFILSKLTVQGKPVKGDVLDVPPGADINLNIEAGNKAGSIEGLVIDKQKAVPAALAVLIPTAEDGLLPAQSIQTSIDGSFQFDAVPAGDYLLFATRNLDLEYQNPAAVRRYLFFATAVTVTSGNTERLSIPVLSGGPGVM